VEWHPDNCYNSFNSYKGLMYFEWYRAILEGKFLPPVEASVDPVNACNLSCCWCNNAVTKARDVMMDGGHLIKLVQFCKEWGVKGLCIAGGGEPTLHPMLGDAINEAGKIGLPVALMTNGTFLAEGSKDAAAKHCRWIGVSVDAARPETYLKLKSKDAFDTVTRNISWLVNTGAHEVMYKFLLHPKNQNEVYEAISTACRLGCHGIHIRPLSFRNYQETEDDYDIEAIDAQVAVGRKEYESCGFKVFYIKHKFDSKLHRKFGFKKCLATPLMPIFHANGDMSLCVDRKNDPSMVFGKHDPISGIKKIWGSKEHKQVIDSVNLDDCPKCTFNVYNQQIEQAVIENRMDYEFT